MVHPDPLVVGVEAGSESDLNKDPGAAGGEMGPEQEHQQCLPVFYCSECQRKGQMAALLPRGSDAKACVSRAYCTFGWGSGSLSPSPAAVTHRQAVILNPSRCPCVFQEGKP